MYILIIVIPLIGFLLIFAKGSFILRRTSSLIAIISMSCSVILSIMAFIRNLMGTKIKLLSLGEWFCIGHLKVDFLFLFDSLTCIMLLVVTIISFLVHLYSLDYMAEDPELPLFLAYLLLFTFFMLVLVTAGNFVVMFLGWEGVGLSSYLLINFWHTRILANKAAIKAIILNKIGDMFFMLALAGIFFLFGSLDFFVVFPMAHIYENNLYLDFITLSLLGGAVAKSAQLGLHTWLPDAMEGPSPVSALIHAATMLLRGIFLIIRCSPLFEHSTITLTVCTLLGAITAFFAASIGLFQNDIKKIIAYSTCSQLGYMLFACGLSGYNFALFHLFNHAFFKALLFLSAGSIIHSLSNEQDIRRMGGLIKFLPLTYVATLIGSLSLIGFPFLAGFYSKDAILELAYSSYSTVGFFAYILGSVSAFLTSFYSFRLMFLVYYDKPKTFKYLYVKFTKRLTYGNTFNFLSLASIFSGIS